MAVAQSEFARFVHLARKALNIKLGLSNAMLSLFSHIGAISRLYTQNHHFAAQRTRRSALRGPSATKRWCSPLRPRARSSDDASAARRPHSRDHSLSAPVNLQLPRCEHDETDRVAPSGALLWTRGWHPKPIMLHGARKADSRQNSKRRAPASPSPRAQTGPLMRPHRAAANRRRIHECNGLCACAYPPPAGPNALEAEERWPPSHW